MTTISSAEAVPVTILDHGGWAYDSSQLSTPVISFANEDDRLLLVGFFSVSENFVDIQPTSLSYNGQQLTHLGGIVQNEFTDYWVRTDIYYMLNPAAYSNYGVHGIVNASNPTGFKQEAVWGMWAMGLSGAAQQAPNIVFSQAQNPAGPSQTLGGTVTTSEDDSLLVGFTGLNAGLSGDRLGSSTGVVELADGYSPPMNYGAGYKQVPTQGSTPFTWATLGYSTGLGATVVVEVQTSTVPEPTTASMILLGLAVGLASRSRMRRI